MSPDTKSADLVFYTNPQSRGGIVHWMLEEIGCPYTIRVLDTLSAWLQDRTYVAGDRFTAADVLLASHLQWGMMTGLIEKRRAFETYIANHVTRPAAKRADEQAEKLTAQQAWKAE